MHARGPRARRRGEHATCWPRRHCPSVRCGGQSRAVDGDSAVTYPHASSAPHSTARRWWWWWRPGGLAGWRAGRGATGGLAPAAMFHELARTLRIARPQTTVVMARAGDDPGGSPVGRALVARSPSPRAALPACQSHRPCHAALFGGRCAGRRLPGAPDRRVWGSSLVTVAWPPSPPEAGTARGARGQGGA